MAKRKKSKSHSTVAGVATGLAAAAANGLVRAAVGRLGDDAKDNSAAGRDHERSDKKKKKRSKKDKHSKKADAATQSRKQAPSAEDAGIELLGELATSARKRLAKLADKLGSVTTKRRALIEELGALQEGIAAALQRFGTGSDPAEETRAKSPKKSRARKSAAADRSVSSRQRADRIDADVASEVDVSSPEASTDPGAEH